MKEWFVASICANGLQGGTVYLVDKGFYFLCQKLTIADEYKKLHIPYESIKSISAGKRVLVLPTTVIETRGGRTYRFLIFHRKKFKQCIKPYLASAQWYDGG